MEWKIGIVALALLVISAGALFAFSGMAGQAGDAVRGMMGAGTNGIGMPGTNGGMMGMVSGMNSGDMLSMHNAMHGTSLTREQFDELHKNMGSMHGSSMEKVHDEIANVIIREKGVYEIDLNALGKVTPVIKDENGVYHIRLNGKKS